jgi:hypothetical protein
VYGCPGGVGAMGRGGVYQCGSFWRAVTLMIAFNDGGLVDSLNSKPEYSGSRLLNTHLNADNDNVLNITLDTSYCDPNQFIFTYANTKKPIFLSLNVQSLMSKFESLKTFLTELINANVPIDAVALQETWTILYTDLLSIPGFQTVQFTNRVGSRGGGVGFYVRDGLQFEKIDRLSTFTEKTFESLTIEIQYPGKKITISNIYRSPNPPSNCTVSDHLNQFITMLNTHLDYLYSRNKMAVVFLDSNINLHLLQNDPTVLNYLNTILSNGFLQMITKSTRVQGPSHSLIDHLLLNKNFNDGVSGTLISDISDHFINYHQIATSTAKNKQKIQSSRKFSPENMDRFKLLLRGNDWNPVLTKNDVDSAFGTFWDEFKPIYDICFPLTASRFNRNIHKINGHMTAGLLISRMNKNRLHKTALVDPCLVNITKYKAYRNIYNSLIRKSKKLYFEDNLNANVNNPKKSWELLKEATVGTKNTKKINCLSVGGNLVVDPNIIADEFNKFFTSIGTTISESVRPTAIDPIDLMPDHPNLNDIEFNNIGPLFLCDLLKTFTTKSSCDLDGISIKLLKHVISEICTPLAYIFNLSVTSGIFPSMLKTSRTVPIFKAGSPLLCDNFRPIYLLSTLSKLLEKIICRQLVAHLEDNNLLYMHQYGFQHAKSTEHNLLQFTNYIHSALNEKKYAIGIFLDLKKAFDVCSHSILLRKLAKLGIRGTALKWFTSYLHGRMQCVDINGHTSTARALDISVLQGSILGPILFLCYINDLHHCITLFTSMFADDTACADADTDLNELITRANTELKKLATWFRANKMAVNIGKTKFIIFHYKGKNTELNGRDLLYDDNEPNADDPHIIIPLERYHNNHPNPDCRAYKLLGINLDENLLFNYHTNFLCNKLTRSLHQKS